jgi:tol-pal system protein YbgF
MTTTPRATHVPRLGALVCAVALAASACGGGDAERARRAAAESLAALNAQVEELKKGQEASTRERARIAEQMKAVDAQQAFLVAEAKALRDELGVTRRALTQSEASVRELRAAIDDVEKKVEAAAPAASAGPAASSPDKLYSSAMTRLRADESAQAIRDLTELVDRFPQHALASNAQYWIGEARYRQGEFGLALAAFRSVVDGYPQSGEVPEALLKVGLCQREMKDATAARESWERLVKSHPSTSAANQARAFLRELGGSPRGAR